MKIGIDGSRAFLKSRTGVEEYSYQVIKHLEDKLNNYQVVLYVQKIKNEKYKIVDSKLPNNWKIKIIKWPLFWTQIGLSLEMLLHSVDVLFIPAHTVPIIHPSKTIVTIHGLEYETMPKAYSFWERLYMRASIKKSCFWAKTIVAVSKNTKKDLIKWYKVPAEKIKVIYEGENKKVSLFGKGEGEGGFEKFLLFVGRLEKRKNIQGIIKSFEILKEKYKIPHKLILAGGKGYGYKEINYQIINHKYKNDIIKTGYISENKKWELLKKADVFLFPTFYEGFGLPILEAQSVGTPVVASNNSSIPEIVSDNSQLNLNDQVYNNRKKIQNSAVLVNPHKPQEIAETVWKLISDKELKNDIIKKGYKNIKRFSWNKCAFSIAELLKNNERKK